MKKIFLVAGAWPNFMKIAPIVRALQNHPDCFEFQIIHTGQHYDRDMSGTFFEELGIPEPRYHLECGGGSHAEQTAKIMIAFEKVCQEHAADCVLVVGDVNSTLACAIVAKKLQIPVAHVEAGLRSGDMTMPEEINRLVTDSISDWFFCTEPVGVKNLLAEGKPKERVFDVGHVMVDNLLRQFAKLNATDRTAYESEAIKKELTRYAVLTLHRPSNVDDPQVLCQLFGALNQIAELLPIVFPVHPRTRANLERFGVEVSNNIHLTRPLSYMEFLNLWKDAIVVLTDSGGLQEETTALGIPCLTLRHNTERPITVEEGTNTVVGTDPVKIIEQVNQVLAGHTKQGRCPELWDGHAAERIVQHLAQLITQKQRTKAI